MAIDDRTFVPFLQIMRGIEQRAVRIGQHHRHDPARAGGVPKDVGIAKIGRANVEHRVAGILLPGPAVVGAPAEILRLAGADPFGGIGVERNHRARPKPGAVRVIDHRRARKDHTLLIFFQGNRQLFPSGQIAADRVAPVHVAPVFAVGVVLVEQVPFARVADQPVGIAQPIGGSGVVILRSHEKS